MTRILILDDNIDVALMLKQIFEGEGHEAQYLLEPEDVLEVIEQWTPNLITLDISFNGDKDESGIAILESIRQAFPDKNELPVFVISGTLNATKMKKLGELGISGYSLKPLDREQLIRKINSCLLTAKNHSGLKFELNDDNILLGEDPAIIESINDMCNAAQAQSSMLIMGGTGTGKEVAVNTYRQLSPRKNKPFVIVDCPLIPSELFESEVFGYMKGAFADARQDKKGKVEEAQGGILFLDEIGDLKESHQSKLLRLIQHKTFTRLGSNKPITLDVVILAATNRDLFQLVQEGKFRADLYYRLKVNRIIMPALKDRREDIPILFKHFVEKFSRQYKKNIQEIEQYIFDQLKRQKWEGNVRELENCAAFSVVNCVGDRLCWTDVSRCFENEKAFLDMSESEPNNPELDYKTFQVYLKDKKEAMEKKYYNDHLEKNDWNKAKTAKAIGIAPAYLNQIIERLKLKKPEKIEMISEHQQFQ